MIYVSIVVPIYKVEKYLEQCLISLSNQTLKNIEIILVDDGSPDNSGNIAEEWSKKYSYIKVIHQENQYYGTAVNNGIYLAQGEYIGIVEPDDWVEPTMFEKLYLKAKNFNAQAARCGFYIYNSKKCKYLQNKIWRETKNLLQEAPKGRFSPLEYKKIFSTHSAIWTYIFRRDILEKIKLDTGRKAYQDMPFIFEILLNIESLVIVPEMLYHYRMEEGSGSSSMSLSLRSLDMIDMTELSLEKLKKFKNNKELKEIFYQHLIKANQYFWKNTPNEKKEEYIQKMHDLFLPFDNKIAENLSPQFFFFF